MAIKVGDKVIVIAGSNKGKEGTVKKVLREENRVIVEGVNLVKRHQKGNGQETGGILMGQPRSPGYEPADGRVYPSGSGRSRRTLLPCPCYRRRCLGMDAAGNPGFRCHAGRTSCH